MPEKLPLWTVENGEPKKHADHVALAAYLGVKTETVVSALASCYDPTLEIVGQTVYMIEPDGTEAPVKPACKWVRVYAYRNGKLMAWINLTEYARDRGVRPGILHEARRKAVDGVFVFEGETLYLDNPQAQRVKRKVYKTGRYYKGGPLLVGHVRSRLG